MDTILAFAMGEAHRGMEMMVFDWNKAAKIIREKKPKVVRAGLRDDWEYTGGVIYENGSIVFSSSCYLASTWAVPEISVDGEVLPCYIMQRNTKWTAETKWPPSAIRILQGE